MTGIRGPVHFIDDRTIGCRSKNHVTGTGKSSLECNVQGIGASGCEDHMVRTGTPEEISQFFSGLVYGLGCLQSTVMGAAGGVAHGRHGANHRIDHRLRFRLRCFYMIKIDQNISLPGMSVGMMPYIILTWKQ